jgi:hypothetical protein
MPCLYIRLGNSEYTIKRNLSPSPPEKTGEGGAESARPTPRGFRTGRAPLVTWRKKEASHRDTSLFRIFGEKGSNFIQESAQIREKLGIARKRRKHIAMRRAGRHSSPDPSCRPALRIAMCFRLFRAIPSFSRICARTRIRT